MYSICSRREAKSLYIVLLLAGCAILSSSAGAAGLGNIRVRSALGEPFAAVVHVTAGEGEELTADCFRLAEAESGDGVRNLRHANLEFQRKGAGGELHIRGVGVESEPLLRLVVRLRCAGDVGNGITREYSALLDPREYKVSLPLPAAPAPSSAARSSPEAQPLLATSRVAAVRESADGGAPSSRKREKIAKSRSKVAPGAASQESRFQLQLSTAALDPARLSIQLSEEEKLRLRERMMLLETDDQVAQLMQLKDRIMRLEKQLMAASHVASAVAVAPAIASAVAIKPLASKPEEARAGESEFFGLWFWGAFASLCVAVAGCFAWFWRKRRGKEQADGGLFEFELDEESKAVGALSPAGGEFSHAQVARPVADAVEQPPLPSSETEVDVFHPDTVLEEAQLLIDHGLARQAIGLLEDEIKRRPLFVALWIKLFEACRMAGEHQQFAVRAQEFRTHFLSDALWHQVQTIGRELDPANPLYREDSGVQPVDRTETAQAGNAEVDFSLEFELPEPGENAAHQQAHLMFGDEAPLLDLPQLEVSSSPARMPETDYVSDDPVLQDIARMIQAGQRDEACNRLEELLYRGAFEQRVIAAAWLDRLLPVGE